MEINITETNYIDVKHTAFADICRFDDIADWIEAIIQGKVAFFPHDCTIQIFKSGKVHRITEAAIVHPEAQKVVDKIRKIPKNYRHIPNDTTQIKGNTFERELYFKLNVPNQR